MQPFVYSCEECISEMDFIVSVALGKNIGVPCSKCNEVKKFGYDTRMKCG
tara:strand:+ start:82 stop:231 length:150 start_codon:yes stop_codon:yes gene_type:complete